MNEHNKPFSQSYVLSVTFQNMRSAVQLSISKTIGRLPDFDPGSEKHNEILDTLASLNNLARLVDATEVNNQHLMKDSFNA